MIDDWDDWGVCRGCLAVREACECSRDDDDDGHDSAEGWEDDE